jgi:hypothetical protein
MNNNADADRKALTLMRDTFLFWVAMSFPFQMARDKD